MIVMKKVSLLALAIALLALASCKSSPKSEEIVSNINNALQDSVEAILEKHFVDHDTYSISSEGFLLAVVDIMAI